MTGPDTEDQRFMAACIRLARRHTGLTGTNPSVGTLIVNGGRVVGRGITALGGRPHAEPLALAEAGEEARGATAYVTLEPCAHHGVTPPCAQALIDAGVARVVTAWIDPDARVDGKGHAMLRAAGIAVETGPCAGSAARDLAPYLARKARNRPHVTLKLAVSKNHALGLRGREVAITGPLARTYVHRMRAEADAILVGRGTVEADDPELTCRLPGLEGRSPRRFVMMGRGQLSPESRLARSATTVPVHVVTSHGEPGDGLKKAGVRHFAAEDFDGRIALPEMLEDMAEMGIASLMVEGGARLAQSFLMLDRIDRLVLFTAPDTIAAASHARVQSPIHRDNVPDHLECIRELRLGDDRLSIFERNA